MIFKPLKYEIHTPQTSTRFHPNRADVPVGSYELDLKLSLPEEVRVDSTAKVNFDRSNLVQSASFYQFDDERSYEKFEAGQIWAFYGDDEDDQVPRHYGKIKEVRRIGSRIELQVHASIVGRNKDYEIYPRLGEIWALYREWTSKLKPSDLKNCEYDIVEVTQDGYSWTHVLFLEKVSGYISVFKRKLTKKLYISIDRTEVLRFSHKIPAFKLTQEHDSNLKGFWELDPGAIPVRYLR